VPQLPAATVRALLDQAHEVPAALSWARRHGIQAKYEQEPLTLEITLTGPSAGGAAEVEVQTEAESYLVIADLTDYDVLPPAWQFVDPRNGKIIGTAAYPVGGGIFHGNGVICAPWNRLAYGESGGPHSDWGPPTGWKTPRPPYTYAVTIPDMLERIVRETRGARGRMAPLPPRDG
jgi:hypothetical protein